MVYERKKCRISYRFRRVILYSLGFLFLLGSFCPAEDLKREDKTGFFRVKQIEGIWWLIDPAGEPFYSVGLCYCTGPRWPWGESPADAPDGPEYKAYEAKYEEDSKVFYKRFREWNFNTAAAWGGNFNGRAPRVLVFTCLWRALQKSENVPTHPEYDFLDVYSPKFKEVVERWAERIVKPNANDPLLIGWFIDNEKPLPQDEAFQEQYFKVAVGALRKYDKNHMLLGTRHETANRTELDLRMEAKYCDVLSINYYGIHPPLNELQRYYKTTGKPMMMTEFTFAAKDSGLPNPASHVGMLVETQKDRAKCYEIYVSTAASLPYVVGTHFFSMHNISVVDLNNWGILDPDGIPYYAFVSRLPDSNAKLPAIHAGKIKPKRYPDDYPDFKLVHNDNPRTRNKEVMRDATGNWAGLRANTHYTCTSGTGPFYYQRLADESWGTQEHGFIEYRFDIEKDFNKPFLVLRYSRFPNRPTHVLKLQVNNEDTISVSLPASIGEPTVPPGWDYGFRGQKLNTITIPLEKPIRKGVVNVRFCVTKPWKNGKGVQLHSFFLTNGSSYKVDGENFYQLVPLGSSEKME